MTAPSPLWERVGVREAARTALPPLQRRSALQQPGAAHPASLTPTLSQRKRKQAQPLHPHLSIAEAP